MFSALDRLLAMWLKYSPLTLGQTPMTCGYLKEAE